MRSNLCALKNLTTQMNKTQNRLATGLKVNTAIDNASSYYQARALNNRASDLDALLDSMGQSIQIINTAIKGLEKSGEMLEQAAVIAEQAYEAAIIPEKAWFEAQVGPNGAVVSTAQELKDAVNSGKETICVYGKIDYFEDQTLTMKANQKLVGTEYFTGYTGNKKFSEINFKGTQQNAINTGENSLISDLCLNFESNSLTTSNFIAASSVEKVYLINLDINHNVYSSINGNLQGVIKSIDNAKINVGGIVNINSLGARSGFALDNSAQLTIDENAKVNIICKDTTWGMALVYNNSAINIYGKLNAMTDYYCILGNKTNGGAQLNIYKDAELTIKHLYVRLGKSNEDIYNKIDIEEGAKININDSKGKVYLLSRGYQYTNSTDSNVNIYSTTLKNSNKFKSYSAVINWDNFANTEVDEAEDEKVLAQSFEQYGTMMNSFDEIVEESSYLGVNLLTGGAMTTIFNENRDHSFVVQGEDMRAESLGITMREWNTREDIAASIKEIKAAMGKVRDMVESLGNNLSIIQTRENFTDKLIDVLQTGADDLVLADMNEESANYLALQTRNNLAVNALALTAQSGNAVLKLF